MESNDSVDVLMAQLEALIERVIDRKFTEMDEKFDGRFDEINVANNQLHKLVNSRMTRMLELQHQLAEAEELVSSNKAEKRGIAIGRKLSGEPPEDDKVGV